MSDTGSKGAMRVDTEMVKTLAQLLSENDLSEIEVEDGDRRISVKRKLQQVAYAPVAAPPPPAAHAPAPAAPAALGNVPVAEQSGPNPNAVPSPMVGTAYLSADPASKPFVSLGDRVEEGDTLLIIEAMKVMNQIAAPRAGTVTKILVQNAEPVEYGQPLVVIE